MADPFIGEIRMFAGTFAPRNFLMCTGAIVDISDYTALFSLLGTAYGGNGTTTFGLPDLRGRLPVGVGTTHLRGGMYGQEYVTLAKEQMPSHTHATEVAAQAVIQATTDQADHKVPGTNTRLALGYAPDYGLDLENYAPAGTETQVTLAGPVTQAQVTLSQSGSSLRHVNVQPCLAINYIIAYEGTYPPRP